MPYRNINIDQEDLDAISANPMWNLQGFVATAIKNELRDQVEVARFVEARKTEKLKLHTDVIDKQSTEER